MLAAVEMLTNRELLDAYESPVKSSPNQFIVLTEMCKRLGYKMVYTADKVIPEFKHWKLNGAGDQRH